MKRCRLLFVVAILPEARALARAFRLRGDFRGLVGGGEVGILMVGLRAGRLRELAGDIEAAGIVMAGLAGGLSPGLRVADVVVASDSGVARIGDWEVVPLRAICESRGVVASAAEKARLFGATGACAVDMETHVVAAFAREMGVPFMAIRAISDGAADEVDPELLTLIDDVGNPRVGRAVRLAGRHPGKVRAMLRMKRAADRALLSLQAAAAAVAASGWPGGSGAGDKK